MPKPTFFNLPEDKQQIIVDAAIDEFATQGYNAASISRIVAQAGIAKGSFYQYFIGKADLYHHLLEIGGRAKAQFLAQPPETDLPPFEYLRWLLKGSVGFEVANPRLAKIAYRATTGDGPDDPAFQTQIRTASHQFFQRLVQNGIEKGQLDPTLNVEMAAFVFFATISQITQYIIETARVDVQPETLVFGTENTAHAEEIEAIFDRMLHILEHGMGLK